MMQRLLHPFIVLALLLATAGPAAAAITSYRITGAFYAGGNLIDPATATPPADPKDVVPDLFPSDTPYILRFDLDDTAAGTPAGAHGMDYPGAVTGLTLTVGGTPVYASPSESASEFINTWTGGGNHQWSIFGYGGSVDPAYASLSVYPSGLMFPTLEDILTFDSMELYLMDSTSTLYTQDPPELVAFGPGDVSIGPAGWSALDLVWRGNT